MKKILHLDFTNIKDIPQYKIVDSQKESEENKKIISFNVMIMEGQYKDTKINFLKVSYKNSHVDFRVYYDAIFDNGIKITNNQCEDHLNDICGNIALRELVKIS